MAGCGEYLLPVKENQRTLRRDLEVKLFRLGGTAEGWWPQSVRTWLAAAWRASGAKPDGRGPMLQ